MEECPDRLKNHRKRHFMYSVMKMQNHSCKYRINRRESNSSPLGCKVKEHPLQKLELEMKNGVFWDVTSCGSCKN
jgi:hypothetical protein